MMFTHCDHLERRRLISHTPPSLTSRGTLIVHGTAGSDIISVSTDGTGTAQVRLNADTTQFVLADIARIFVQAEDGDDEVVIDLRIPSTLLGGLGDDTLIGSGRSDTLEGGDGDDFVNGRGGYDRVSYADHSDSVRASIIIHKFTQTLRGLGESDTELDSFRSCEFLAGGTGDDRLSVVTDFSAGFLSEGFSVTLSGAGGNDVLSTNLVLDGGSVETQAFGDRGDDSFFAVGEASEQFFGGSGNDTCSEDLDGIVTFVPGPGRDLLRSVGARDTFAFPADLEDGYFADTDLIRGNDAGNTIIIAGGGSATVTCGTGDDSIVVADTNEFLVLLAEGNSGDDTIRGGDGPDVLSGGYGDDLLVGGGGDDELIGDDGDDTMRGGVGNDLLGAGRGRDKLYGDDGDDLLLGRGGSKDRLDGGDGTDAATADSGPSVTDLVLNSEDVR